MYVEFSGISSAAEIITHPYVDEFSVLTTGFKKVFQVVTLLKID